MFGFLRRRPRGPHPHQRELQGLVSCIVAWRRAVLEAYHHDRVAEAASLEARRAGLQEYVRGLGGTEPFTTEIVAVPVGDLDEPRYLAALFRIETAVAIAWALGLADALPSIEERADHQTLDRLFPLAGAPARSIAVATLRDRAVLARHLAEQTSIMAAARRRRDEAPGEATALPFSRAYERTRGLAWVVSDARWIDDVTPA